MGCLGQEIFKQPEHLFFGAVNSEIFIRAYFFERKLI